MINWGAKGSTRIAQNVQNLIVLKQYDLPLCRRWGISAGLIDTKESTQRPRLIAEAYDIVSSGEPRAVIENIFFNPDGKLEVKINC